MTFYLHVYQILDTPGSLEDLHSTKKAQWKSQIEKKEVQI